MVESIEEIAHRGYRGIYPQNTTEAFRKATAGERYDSPDMIELDVRRTADGEVVVFHFNNLKGGKDSVPVTDMTGKLCDTRMKKLKSAKVGGTECGIPTLRKAMGCIPDEVGVLIEIKNIEPEGIHLGDRDRSIGYGRKLERSRLKERKKLWTPFVEKVLEESSSFDNDIMIHSFFEGAVAAVRDLDDRMPLGVLTWESIDEGLEIAREHDCDSVNPPLDMINRTGYFNSRTMTDQEYSDVDLVRKAHSEGRKVRAWTVANWRHVQQLREAEVDGVITDYPLGVLQNR